MNKQTIVNIKPFQPSDASFLVQYLNNAQVTRYITNAIAKPYTLKDANWWIENSQDNNLVKAIIYNDLIVGCISTTRGNFEYSRSAELGYWLAEEYWNKGIATQAIALFSELIISDTNITRLFVSVVAENTASIKVLSKNGFASEGTLRNASFKDGQYFDEVIMAKCY